MRLEDIVVEVRDSDRERVGQLVGPDLVGSTFVVRFNSVGSWRVSLAADSPVVDLLRTPGAGILLRGPGGTILSGPTQSARLIQTGEDTEGTWVIEGVSDQLVLVDRVAYPDPAEVDVSAQSVANDIRIGPAETVIKEYVDANLVSGPSVRVTPGLVLATDQARGDQVRGNARFAPMHELIQNLAASGGLGFDVLQVDEDLVFDVYEPTDVSADVRLDVFNDSLSSSDYFYAAPTVTRAIVAGAGEGVERLFIEETTQTAEDAETAWNRRIERFIDQRGTEELEQLQQKALEVLIENGRTLVTIAVTPSETGSLQYGVDWGLGDTVTVVAGDVEAVAVVNEVGISVSEDGLRLAATVGRPEPVTFENRLAASVRDQGERLSNVERNEFIGAAGAVSRTTAGNVTISNVGAYVTTGLDTTLDASTSAGFVKGTTDTFAVKNSTDVTRVMRIYASADARGGNNQTHGVKLALNGSPIDATECRAFTGSSNQEAKLVTSWLVRMQPGDEVALFIANLSTTDDIEIRRGRVVATAV